MHQVEKVKLAHDLAKEPPFSEFSAYEPDYDQSQNKITKIFGEQFKKKMLVVI